MKLNITLDELLKLEPKYTSKEDEYNTFLYEALPQSSGDISYKLDLLTDEELKRVELRQYVFSEIYNREDQLYLLIFDNIPIVTYRLTGKNDDADYEICHNKEKWIEFHGLISMSQMRYFLREKEDTCDIYVTSYLDKISISENKLKSTYK